MARSQRLTWQMRDVIIRQVRDASFVPDLEEIEEQRSAIGLPIYHRIIANEAAVAELRKVAAKFPGFIAFRSKITMHIAGRNERDERSHTSTTFECDPPLPVTPYSSGFDNIENQEVYLELRKLDLQRRKITEAQEELAFKTREILKGFTTVAKLLEAMPELEPFLEPEWKDPPVPKVPAIADTEALLVDLLGAGVLPKEDRPAA